MNCLHAIKLDFRFGLIQTSPYMVNDVFRDAYDIPDMVNIVKLFRAMLTS